MKHLTPTLLIWITLLLSSSGRSLEWKGNDLIAIRNYEKFQYLLYRRHCSQGEDHLYEKLALQNNEEGHYLPVLGPTEIDTSAIAKHLPLLQQKSAWLKNLRATLQKQPRFPKPASLERPLRQSLNRLLRLKKADRMTSNPSEKKEIRRRSAAEMTVLRVAFTEYLSRIPFLLTFRHPVDHLSNRTRYEKYRDSPRASDIHRRNDVFFYRKIHEDGAFDSDHTRPDRQIRAVLDTLALALAAPTESLLPDPVRYDLEWVLPRINQILQRGKTTQLARLDEWIARTDDSTAFYADILHAAGKDADQNKIRSVLTQRNLAAQALKDFVLRKEAAIYQDLAKRDELTQALYVFDQILFNEIGDAPERDIEERRDIAQIVLNRVKHPQYSQLGQTDSLLAYLQPANTDELQSHRWLNTLFKEGEFSFTYYYIPSSVRIFCPDQSPRARVIRSRNLRIALDVLRRPRSTFNAIRYFSRVSMYGKIDMSQVWTSYEAIPERAGPPIQRQYWLKRKLRRGRYRYLYTFLDPTQQRFDVLEIGGETYAVRQFPDRPGFFHYRNPHEFKYFVSRHPAQVSVANSR